MSIKLYTGTLEVDLDRGVLYFHNNGGITQLRICKLPKPEKDIQCPVIDITHMYGASINEGKL